MILLRCSMLLSLSDALPVSMGTLFNNAHIVPALFGPYLDKNSPSSSAMLI